MQRSGKMKVYETTATAVDFCDVKMEVSIVTSSPASPLVVAFGWLIVAKKMALESSLFLVVLSSCQ